MLITGVGGTKMRGSLSEGPWRTVLQPWCTELHAGKGMGESVRGVRRANGRVDSRMARYDRNQVGGQVCSGRLKEHIGLGRRAGWSPGGQT